MPSTALAPLTNRIRKNARHFGRWARKLGTDCFRAYDRDIPEFALICDVYGERAHVQEYARARALDDAERSFSREELREATAEGLGLPLENVVVKVRAQRAAGEQHQKTGVEGESFVVQEGGHRFLVNLEAHLDTGLFLDHRNTRRMVQAEANGKRMLNLFCYTASFTVYAAAGGARSSLSVDLSNTYLDWAERNLALNDVDSQHHQVERADVLRWLSEARQARERFDLIVLDPPSLSRSKAMETSFDIQRDHGALITDCAALLAPGGVLYFSTNLQRFRPDADAFAGFAAEEISEETVPEDFRNRRVHRCWRGVRR